MLLSGLLDMLAQIRFCKQRHRRAHQRKEALSYASERTGNRGRNDDSARSDPQHFGNQGTESTEQDWACVSYIEDSPRRSRLFDNCDDRINNTVDIGWMELATVKRGKQALEPVH